MATKQEEIDNPDSCWNKAEPDEMIFVILARDKAAPATLRKWADERLAEGLNGPMDQKIINARAAAATMEEQFRARQLKKSGK